MWCRAFRGTHITPPILRGMELWEIGVLFGGDVDDSGLVFDTSVVMPRAEPQEPGERPEPQLEVD